MPKRARAASTGSKKGSPPRKRAKKKATPTAANVALAKDAATRKCRMIPSPANVFDAFPPSSPPRQSVLNRLAHIALTRRLLEKPRSKSPGGRRNNPIAI